MGVDSERISNLIECVQNLPPPSRTTVLDHLESLDPCCLRHEQPRSHLCETSRANRETSRFRRHHGPYPAEDIDRLKAIYERFKPEEKILQVLPLFTASPLLLEEPEEPDRMKHESAVYEAQVAAAYQVYQFEGLMGLFTLVERSSSQAYLAGFSAEVGLVEAEEDHILHELGSSDASATAWQQNMCRDVSPYMRGNGPMKD